MERQVDDQMFLPPIHPINHEQDDVQIDRSYEEFIRRCNENNSDPNQQLMRQIDSKLPQQQQPPNDFDQNQLRQLMQMIDQIYYRRTSEQIVHEMKEEQNRMENQDRKLLDLLQKSKTKNIKPSDLTVDQKKLIQQNIKQLKENCKQMMDNLQNVFGKIDSAQDQNKKILVSSIPKKVPEWEIIERDIPTQITDLVKNKQVKGLYDMRLDQQTINLKKLLDKQMIDVISINFTNCNFTNESIQQLVDRSNRIPNVTTLYLSYNQFTVLTKQQLNTMKRNMKYLTKIYILNSKDSSAKMLLPQSVREILEFMYQQQRLRTQHKTVVIMNQWDLFKKKFQLEKMTFFNPLAFSKVQKLNLHGNEFNDQDFVTLSNLVSQFPSLIELNLSNNGFSLFAQKILQILYDITKDRKDILSINLCKLVGNSLKQQTLKFIQKVFQSKKGAKITIVCDRKLRLQNELIMRAKNELRKGLEGVLRNLAVGVLERFMRGQIEDVDRLIVRLVKMVPFWEVKQIIESVSEKFASNSSTTAYTRTLKTQLQQRPEYQQNEYHQTIQQSAIPPMSQQQPIQQSTMQGQITRPEHELVNNSQ